MVNFRHVTITSEDLTQKVDLNDFDGYLMTSPTGFGIYRTSEYFTIGSRRIRSSNKNAFQKITMDILIAGARNEWENKYARLRNFIAKNLKTGFRLYYTPCEETRYIKCDINIVDKTEKSVEGLRIKLEIQPLTLWLMDVQKQTIEQTSSSANSFVFALREYETFDSYCVSFDESSGLTDEFGRLFYSIDFSDGSALQRASLNNSGAEETPLLIRIYGYAINPIVRLMQEGSNEYSQIITFENLTIEDGYYLEINSDPANTYIDLVSMATGARLDRESFANIDSNIYINLPVGVWNIDVGDESGINKCRAEVFFATQHYGG